MRPLNAAWVHFPLRDLDDPQGAVFSVSVARSVSSGGFNARNDL